MYMVICSVTPFHQTTKDKYLPTFSKLPRQSEYKDHVKSKFLFDSQRHMPVINGKNKILISAVVHKFTRIRGEIVTINNDFYLSIIWVSRQIFAISFRIALIYHICVFPSICFCVFKLKGAHGLSILMIIECDKILVHNALRPIDVGEFIPFKI